MMRMFKAAPVFCCDNVRQECTTNNAFRRIFSEHRAAVRELRLKVAPRPSDLRTGKSDNDTLGALGRARGTVSFPPTLKH